MERTRFKSDSNRGTPQTLGQKARHSIMKKQRKKFKIRERKRKEQKAAIKLRKAKPLDDKLRLKHNDKTLNEKREKLLMDLMPEIRQQPQNKLNDLSIILANLLPKKTINISLDNSRLTKYSYLTTSNTKIIKAMEQHGYIKTVKRGYYSENGGMRTRIKGTPKLFKWFDELPELSAIVELLPPKELLQLKDAKTKKLINYKDTPKTKEIRRKIKRVNEINGKATITHEGQVVSVHLHAVYHDDFNTYGRLHTSGARWAQGFSKKERSEFLINGEPVVEWDFAGFHPNLLYAKEGIQYTGDPYSVVDKREEVRPFLKIILLCMINSKNLYEARGAAKKWLKIKEGDSNEEKQNKELLEKLGINNAQPFVEKFMEVHQPISKYFGKGKGTKIMNWDAKIALDIIDWFAKRGIPVIPIHDSFVVQKRYEDKLKKMMKRVYKKHTSFGIEIKKNF